MNAPKMSVRSIAPHAVAVDVGDEVHLFSYDVEVARTDGKLLVLHDGWYNHSPTIMRHVREFARQCGHHYPTVNDLHKAIADPESDVVVRGSIFY